ncbi:response regulator transcription factor [Cohnella thailandensis]|uniref:Response regulator n=1 Tax=Cohnella thailandensis TaxID=557557 RepID=A0A841T0I9_9BACL|nr:AraC family transcriptional regulator [Cohnella thailandensis]MBB6636065.1 response regulator [Cohnella thailandensis]MBP1976780.1 DNA-binding NarL/FixJ family response regulator/AraC-like DNA-binding protein [Cohnella thailandensis]
MFRILIAEDEPLLLKSIADKIRQLDPDFKIVGEYENGEYAVLELDLLRPHVVLTDIYMPVMDGLSLIRHVRERSPATICAILTGYRDFEYARQAIQLGVSDLLLKPPTADILGPFLAETKRRLSRNQTLVEAELLQQWMLRKEEGGGSEEIRRLAQEYFYHSRYLVLYARVAGSPESQAKIPSLLPVLEDGERQYALPPIGAYEGASVIGVHNLTEARLEKLLEYARSELQASAACVTAVAAAKLQDDLHPALELLRRASRAGFPLEGKRVRSFRGPHDRPYDIPPLPLPGSLEQELAALWVKKRKSDFVRKLEGLLLTEAWSNATRAQWQQTLTFLTNSLLLHEEASSPKAPTARWHHELEDAVWRPTNRDGIIEGIREFFDTFFDEMEQEAEASWTEELKLYLENRYMENITLAELAERFGLNPSYLGRVYKRKYGQSPIDNLIQIRIDRAKKLILERPRLLFREIAEMVGCADPFYFSKLFKQWTGLTPREFKKNGGY